MSALNLKTPSGGSISLTPTDTASNVALTLPATTTTLVDSSSLAASGGSSLVGFLQSGAGAVISNYTVQDKLRETVSVLDFGADPTGVADSTAAIQASIDAALAAGQRIVAAGTFKTSGKIVIKGDADFSQAIFNVYGTPTVAVEVSTGNATDPTTEIYKCVIWLPKNVVNMTKPATGWAGQGIGVRVVSAYDCHIFVGCITDFATGLLVTSYNTNGSINNTFYLGALQNNKVNIALTPGDSTAWVNENLFLNGHFSHYSAEGTNISGVRHILISKAAHTVNNNLFVKPNIESDTAEYQVENGGAHNTIQQGRWECTPPKVLYTADNDSNQAIDNVILGGYNLSAIQFTYTTVTPGVGGNWNKVIGGRGNNYDSGSSSTGIYKYTNSGSSLYPIHTFYEASNTVRPENATSTQWAMQHSASFLMGKRSTDSYYRLKLDYQSGRIYFDNGTTAAPTAYISNYGANDIALAGCSWKSQTDNTYSLGTAALRWSATYSTQFRPGAGTAIWTSGTGSPESVVTAPIGSLYTRTDGGAGTTLYIKESGAGNTGWVAK